MTAPMLTRVKEKVFESVGIVSPFGGLAISFSGIEAGLRVASLTAGILCSCVVIYYTIKRNR